MTYYLVSWRETRREPVNHFGRLGYVCYHCTAVLEVEDGKSAGTAFFSPLSKRLAALRLSTCESLEELPGKPRKNAKVWHECKQERGDTLSVSARASESRRYGRRWN